MTCSIQVVISVSLVEIDCGKKKKKKPKQNNHHQKKKKQKKDYSQVLVTDYNQLITTCL